MKVFLSADMEGISGIATEAMTEDSDKDYDRARELMTGDVNAAIKGALAAGATEVWTKDAHGDATNLLVERLQAPAQLIQGWNGPARMMEGVDESFAAALLIGYHARAMTDAGTLSHTMAGRVRGLWYNGVEVGESAISAAHAGYHGVPLVFASGDEALCAEVHQVIGLQVETAAVKTAYARECVCLLPVGEARRRIRDGVARALARREEIPPFRPGTPIEVRLQFHRSVQARAASLVPTVQRLDDTTVAATVDGGLAAANLVAVLLDVTG